MHEWSIADNLVKLVVQATEREGLTLVSRVVIQVGVLRQVVPESLELAFSCRTGKGVEKWGQMADRVYSRRYFMDFLCF